MKEWRIITYMSVVVKVKRFIEEGQPNKNGVIIQGTTEVLQDYISDTDSAIVSMHDPRDIDDIANREVLDMRLAVGTLLVATDSYIIVELYNDSIYFNELVTNIDKYRACFVTESCRTPEDEVNIYVADKVIKVQLILEE